MVGRLAKRGGDVKELRDAQGRLEECFGRQMEFWSARSQYNWLKNRDRNTSYFHQQAS